VQNVDKATGSHFLSDFNPGIFSQICIGQVYKVYYKNYGLKRGDLIGMLIERRKSLREMTRVESGLGWAKFTLSVSPSPVFKDGVRKRGLGSTPAYRQAG
jgi:hypothetical protein